MFSQYPLMASSNGVVAVTFPAAGSYPYEVDYRSGTGGALVFAITPVRPLHTLVLTTAASATPVTGQSVTFTVQANDETGAAMAQLPVNLAVSGVHPQTLASTTDATGKATFTYTGTNSGNDLVQATATLAGLSLITNTSTLAWTLSRAPQITVNGDASLTLPNRGQYTATVTNFGTGLTVAWTKVSGPGEVVFEYPAQAATHAAFTAPGAYVLRITATDTLGSTPLDIPITVAAPVTTSQGWIGSPLDHASLTGIVPVTVAAGVTLTSGTLTYYPVSNPSAVVTLNATTMGSGKIGTLDTTVLANGTYYLLLNATDTTGKTQGSGVWVVVSGDYKPGRVTTTVTDLVVPAPGLPIRIERTYDSLQRSTSSDFGYCASRKFGTCWYSGS